MPLFTAAIFGERYNVAENNVNYWGDVEDQGERKSEIRGMLAGKHFYIGT